MCKNQINDHVSLYIWSCNPYRESESFNIDFWGGHVGIEATVGTEKRYLGWWPEFWTVQREEAIKTKNIFKLLLGKVTKLGGKILPQKGRITSFPQQSEVTENIGVKPDQIDAVLVKNKPVFSENGPWEETPPTRKLLIKVRDVKAVFKYIESLKENLLAQNQRYHFFLNNCATVCAAALRAGGINIPRYPIWSPWLLEKHCTAKKLITNICPFNSSS